MLTLAHPMLTALLVGLFLAAIDIASIRLRQRRTQRAGRTLWLTCIPAALLATVVVNPLVALGAALFGITISGTVFCVTHRHRMLAGIHRRRGCDSGC
jgi:uncharacterized membrane protein (DUF441 family)